MYYQTYNNFMPYSPYEPNGEGYNSYRSTTLNSNRFFNLKDGFESGNILKEEYVPYKSFKVPTVTTTNEKDEIWLYAWLKSYSRYISNW